MKRLQEKQDRIKSIKNTKFTHNDEKPKLERHDFTLENLDV